MEDKELSETLNDLRRDITVAVNSIHYIETVICRVEKKLEYLSVRLNEAENRIQND